MTTNYLGSALENQSPRLSPEFVAESRRRALELDEEEARELNARDWSVDPYRAKSLGDGQCWALGVRRGLR